MVTDKKIANMYLDPQPKTDEEFRKMSRGEQWVYLETMSHVVSIHQVRKKYFHYFKACKFCGARENLSLDHKLPTSKFNGPGINSFYNLQVLCRSCNSIKNATILPEYYSEMIDRGLIKDSD